MIEKHGLSQMRLNSAKGYAQEFLDTICKIEMMLNLSVEGKVDGDFAEEYITRNVDKFDDSWKYFKSYIEQREDMR